MTGAEGRCGQVTSAVTSSPPSVYRRWSQVWQVSAGRELSFRHHLL